MNFLLFLLYVDKYSENLLILQKQHNRKNGTKSLINEKYKKIALKI